ncbi:gag-pol polyprotein [Hordeum vulgare]|nr:gag-pol polyprotein [Hordeum vulgare]
MTLFAPKFDISALPLCHGIKDAESSMTLFEDGVMTEPLKEHALEARDMVASKEEASTLGGGDSEMAEHEMFPSNIEGSDEVPHSMAFVYGGGVEMVEHVIFFLQPWCHMVMT